MQAKKLDGCPSTTLLTLFISLQCSDNNLGGGSQTRDVLHVSRGTTDLIRLVFSRDIFDTPSAIKKPPI